MTPIEIPPVPSTPACPPPMMGPPMQLHHNSPHGARSVTYNGMHPAAPNVLTMHHGNGNPHYHTVMSHYGMAPVVPPVPAYMSHQVRLPNATPLHPQLFNPSRTFSIVPTDTAERSTPKKGEGCQSKPPAEEVLDEVQHDCSPETPESLGSQSSAARARVLLPPQTPTKEPSRSRKAEKGIAVHDTNKRMEYNHQQKQRPKAQNKDEKVLPQELAKPTEVKAATDKKSVSQPDIATTASIPVEPHTEAISSKVISGKKTLVTVNTTTSSEPSRAPANHTRVPSKFTEEEIKERKQAWDRISLPMDPRKVKKPTPTTSAAPRDTPAPTPPVTAVLAESSKDAHGSSDRPSAKSPSFTVAAASDTTVAEASSNPSTGAAALPKKPPVSSNVINHSRTSSKSKNSRKGKAKDTSTTSSQAPTEQYPTGSIRSKKGKRDGQAGKA